MQEDDSVQDITILERQEPNMQLGQRKETQSTREKVSAFKNRVFSLLMLFVEKSKNTSILLPFISQDLFAALPDRSREIISVLLKRGCLSSEELLKIAEFYKNFLLYKTKKDVRRFSDDFTQILKKIQTQNKEAVTQIAQEMLEVFITKRKCKLNFSFFPFLLKKLPSLRPNIVALATALHAKGEMRPAQQRVIEKLLRSLVRKHNVKEQHQE